jgi:5-methylcytosine-specific restriction protein B
VEALDTALRRRFEFEEVMPKPEVLENKEVEGINLTTLLKTINERIEVLVDRDHTIGHSYFIKVETKEDLRSTFKNNIIPLLQEYFYGDYGKIGLVLGEGFVAKPVTEKVTFASFGSYASDNDLGEKGYTLNTIDAEFDIVDALEKLLNKKG